MLCSPSPEGNTKWAIRAREESVPPGNDTSLTGINNVLLLSALPVLSIIISAVKPVLTLDFTKRD
jgi:hypothetical protein